MIYWVKLLRIDLIAQDDLTFQMQYPHQFHCKIIFLDCNLMSIIWSISNRSPDGNVTKRTDFTNKNLDTGIHFFRFSVHNTTVDESRIEKTNIGRKRESEVVCFLGKGKSGARGRERENGGGETTKRRHCS